MSTNNAEVYEECLEALLILKENHLRHVPKEDGGYYSHARSHLGVGQHFPISGPVRNTGGLIRRRDIPGGIIKGLKSEIAQLELSDLRCRSSYN